MSSSKTVERLIVDASKAKLAASWLMISTSLRCWASISVKPVLKLLESYEIKGMAHVTGGGFIENVPRMFNGGDFTAVINKDSYPLPAIFERIIEKGVAKDHMYNTFNMGIGFVLAVNEKDVAPIIKDLVEMGEKAYEIGYVTSGGEGICLK